MRVWVFFCHAFGNPWWSRFLDKDFSHCFMIKEQLLYDLPLYIRLEGLTHRIINDVQLLPIENTIENTINLAITNSNWKVKILEGTIDNDYTKPYNQFEFLTCVTLLKKTLGINKPFIVSPKQLFKHLQTTGYKEI